MGKIALIALVLLLVCACALAEEEKPALPLECKALIENGDFSGYSLTSWCKPNEDYIAAILHKDSRNVLILFHASEKGEWRIALTTHKAVPQGPNDARVHNATGSYSMTMEQYGTAFSVNYAPDDGEAWNQVATWQLKEGSWHIASYNTEQPEFLSIIIDDGSLMFLNEDWEADKESTVYGFMETDLRYFDLLSLPKSVEEAREKLSKQPVLPENESDGGLNGLYGKYAFKKQVYMNPLSSFLALDGFHEYYTFSEDAFIITDQNGNQRSVKISCQPAPVDEAAFRDSFMMDGFGIPDITKYKEKRQYTIADISGSAIYRIYLLDNEIWLAQVHKDSVNTKTSEYIWSIYQIEPMDNL